MHVLFCYNVQIGLGFYLLQLKVGRVRAELHLNFCTVSTTTNTLLALQRRQSFELCPTLTVVLLLFCSTFVTCSSVEVFCILYSCLLAYQLWVRLSYHNKQINQWMNIWWLDAEIMHDYIKLNYEYANEICIIKTNRCCVSTFTNWKWVMLFYSFSVLIKFMQLICVGNETHIWS